MKPEDKFGNEIYSHVYDELCEYGARLKQIGYEESRNKPNLFYYQKSGGLTFFMDMRGTGQVKIWEDTRPLFYWNIELTMPNWAKRRMLKEERERLLEHQVPLRLSFYAGLGAALSTDEDTLSDPLGYPDGYCRLCDADIRENKKYCSVECEQEERPNRFCETCEERLAWDGTIRHHVSYFPEETVTVCRSCHNKIHMDDSFHPELTPAQEEIDKFYG